MSKKDDLVFATLPSGETVIGKVVKIGGGIHGDDPEIEPLRYGNEKAANEKASKVKDQLAAQGKSAGVMKSEGRFLVLAYEQMQDIADHISRFGARTKEELEAMSKVMSTKTGLKQLATQYLKPRKLFATVSPDKRCNPRNRHNHGHKGQTDEKYYYVR